MLAWLYAIADRRLVDELRRRSRAASHVRNYIHSAPRDGFEYGSDLIRAIRSSISDLPADQRRVVVMKVFEGRSFAEIASSLDITEAASKMRFSRAIRLVRASLDCEGYAP
jgi:RNA polymerase sigma factor (sigma-70 family)